MRHRNIGRKLGRNSSQRKALFRGLAISLITHETIKTTVPKAKELRRVIEPLVTIARVDSVAHRRIVAARLGNNEAATAKLFNDVAPRFIGRNGGYTRVLKCGFRQGDKAPMAYIQFVEQAAEAAAPAEEAKAE